MTHKAHKVLVGMSGGVDSSVAAALLAEEGYEVVGVSINLLSCDKPIERSCCSVRDREDARDICRQISIQHHVIDCRESFRDGVINPFVREYLAGRTPSPCVVCNELIKFPALIDTAKKLGAKNVATGHYARATRDEKGFHLLKGADPEKDQSYFLFGLNQEILAKTIFPLGGMTKKQVRKIAANKCLKTHEKPDSQEVCFVPAGDCAGFIESRAGESLKGPGNFVSAEGKVVGRHKGIHAYTVGQRRGLGFGIGRRRYVVKIDTDRNEIVLGEDSDLMCPEMFVRDATWICAGSPQKGKAIIKIRSTHAGAPCSFDVLHDGRVHVRFDEPVRAVAPGQAAVFYDGEEVMGGGWILKANSKLETRNSKQKPDGDQRRDENSAHNSRL